VDCGSGRGAILGRTAHSGGVAAWHRDEEHHRASSGRCVFRTSLLQTRRHQRGSRARAWMRRSNSRRPRPLLSAGRIRNPRPGWPRW